MSFHPDPCYCEQASAYEDLLNEVLTQYATTKKLTKELFEKIENTIGEYQQAQAEYSGEGDDDEEVDE